MDIPAGAKCHFCVMCDGHGCIGELPGMGGAFSNENFIRNYDDWAKYSSLSAALPFVRLAPITGAIQNVGYFDEKAFYADIINAAIISGVRLSIGDGYPDEKLKFGIEALRNANQKGAVFIKPYENNRIIERMEWASDVSEIIGIDIDAYAIVTMRNLVNLQQKTTADLIELKKKAQKPFAIKGVFRPEDIALVKEVHPDIVVISNHGGRVETARGSTVDFLAAHGKELASYTGQIWIDGGIRKRHDLLVAKELGASEVMIARPFITALLRSGQTGIKERMETLISQ